VFVGLCVFTIELLLKSNHSFSVVVTYVIWIIEHRYYPHDTLVYNLPFFEGDTSGHVVDRRPLRRGLHQFGFPLA